MTKEQHFVRILVMQRNDALNSCAQVNAELEFTREALQASQTEVNKLKQQLAAPQPDSTLSNTNAPSANEVPNTAEANNS